MQRFLSPESIYQTPIVCEQQNGLLDAIKIKFKLQDIQNIDENQNEDW